MPQRSIFAIRRLAALAGLAVVSTPAFAAAAGFERLTPLPSETLEKTRAGFVTVQGITFSFGANLQTFLDGSLALSSTLTVDDVGQATRTASANPDLGALSSGPAGVGLTIAGNGGVTTFLQGADATALRNLVTTSASDLSIRQATNLNITLSGFETNQAQYAASQTMRAVNNDLGFILTQAPR